MITEGPWEIRKRDHANEIVAHEVLWTVLTDPDNQGGVYVLRIAGHGHSATGQDAIKVLLDPEMAEAMLIQFQMEARPYLMRLNND